MVNAPAQLATATALGVQAGTGTGLGANAQLASAAGTALIPASNITSLAFPAKRLGVRVDLLLGGVWTDITAFVYQRNPVSITGVGRADWTSTLQASQLTLTVNNRDGRFTPKLASGAYFPNIQRNTQIRVFLSVTSSTGVSYAGFRFYGEVSEWPVQWDASQHDIAVGIVAAGIWRRLSQLQTPLGSAYRRFKVSTAAVTGLRSYWPAEDGSGSKVLVPFGSVAGTQNATMAFVAGQAGLSLAAASAFPGSDDIATLNAASVTALVPSGGTATNNVTRFLISVPAAGDSASGTSNWNLIEIDSAGTVAKFEVYLNASGTLLMQLRNSGGTVIAAGTTTTNVKGTPYLVSCELTAGVSFALRIIKAGGSGITESLTGSLGSGSIGQVSKVTFSRALALMDTAVGHLSVAYGAPTSMVQEAYVLNGYLGEFAADRFVRLCGELGIASATIGAPSSSAPMGPQVDDTLANVFQAIEDTDCGLLYELRDQFGMGYRTNASMANQQVQFSLNYAAATVDADLAPSYDDQLTRNNVTVSNWTGYTQQAILTAGPMSVLNPPSGIGNGYNYSRSVSAANDNQCPGIANFLLNLGSVDEIRFPVVTVKMIRAQSASLFAAIPAADIGDYFQITSPPSFLTAAVIKQLIWGYSETLNAREWTFSFNTVPESAWETGFSPGTIQTAQIPGGSPVSSQAQGSLGLASLIANGSITPSMLSGGITVHTLGGNAVTIAVAAPPGPNTNDIWIASATGLISQWNGSAWVPFQFDGTATIQAATITAAQIAAATIVASNIATGTLTAALMAAGIVVAGIVNATTVQAQQYLAYSGLGEFLAYSVANGWQFTVAGSGTTTYFVVTTAQSSLIQVGDTFTWTGQAGTFTVTSLSVPFAGFVNVSFTPAASSAVSSGTVSSGSGSGGTGGLINSIAGAAGTDTYGNSYPQGLFSQQLTLQNQTGSAPPAFSGASVIYSSVAGRPRYLSGAGADTALERSDVNVSQFTVGNTTTPGIISATLNYKADEGTQSSEYEIEIRGNGVGNVTTANTLTFDLYIDGVLFGGGFTIGATFFTNGAPGLPNFRFTLSLLLSITASGAGGTCVSTSTGTAVNSGNFQGGGGAIGLGGISSGSFDSTVNHSLVIKSSWGGTATGQTMTTFRTKLGRRM